LRMAWSIPSGEVPTISVTRYVRLDIGVLLDVRGCGLVKNATSAAGSVRGLTGRPVVPT
jgi:hypothetical protein